MAEQVPKSRLLFLNVLTYHECLVETCAPLFLAHNVHFVAAIKSCCHGSQSCSLLPVGMFWIIALNESILLLFGSILPEKRDI